MPEATGIIGHGVESTGYVVVPRMIPVRALQERVQAQEVGPGGGAGGGSLRGPGNSSAIVAVQPQGAFVDVALSGKNGLVSDGGGELEVRDGDGTMPTIRSDQSSAKCRRKPSAPKDGGCRHVQGVEPHSAHAVTAGITRAHIGRSKGDKFAKMGGTCAQRVGEGAEVAGTSMHVACEPDPELVAPAQCVLEDREKACGARDGQGHRAELAKYLVPPGDGHPFPGWANGVKEFVEAE